MNLFDSKPSSGISVMPAEDAGWSSDSEGSAEDHDFLAAEYNVSKFEDFLEEKDASWAGVSLQVLRNFACYLLRQKLKSAKNYVVGAYVTARDKYGAQIDRSGYLLLLRQIESYAKKQGWGAESARPIFIDDLEGLSQAEKEVVEFLCALGQRCATRKRMDGSNFHVGTEGLRFRVPCRGDKKGTQHSGFVQCLCRAGSGTKCIAHGDERCRSANPEDLVKFALRGLNKQVAQAEDKFALHSFRRTLAVYLRLKSGVFDDALFAKRYSLARINGHVGWTCRSNSFFRYSRDAANFANEQVIASVSEAVAHLLDGKSL